MSSRRNDGLTQGPARDADQSSEYRIVHPTKQFVSTTARDGSTVHQGDVYVYQQLPTSDEPPEGQPTYADLVESLYFEGFDFRLNNVEKALSTTCQWLLAHDKFVAWENNSRTDGRNGFLWIKGKPGCGKSTLMKTALEKVQKQKKKHRLETVIIPYFFNGRAKTLLEKSANGFYRTMTIKLLAAQPQVLQEAFMDRFGSSLMSDLDRIWTREALQGFLFEAVELLETCPIYLFVDGLDEAQYEDDARQLIRFLVRLCDHSKISNGSFQLRVCLSSRHFPHIEIGRGVSLVVEDEDQHAEDIKTYIAEQLVCIDLENRDDLQLAIFQRSARVFLWVDLVVKIIDKLNDQGSSLFKMKAQLDILPSDLDHLFRSILSKDAMINDTTAALLKWVLFAMRPLSPLELYVAMDFSMSPENDPWIPPNRISVPLPARLKKYLLQHSRGLVEIRERTWLQPALIQFIHESVKEFLLKDDGLVSMMPESSSNLTGQSHELLRLACHRRILSTPMPDSFTSGLDQEVLTTQHELESNAPFTSYAISHLFHHTAAAQASGISILDGLKDQIDDHGVWKDQFRLLWNAFPGAATGHVVEQHMTLLYFLVESDFLEIDESIIRTLQGIDAVCGFAGSVLQLAIVRKDKELALMLLAEGADPRIGGGNYGNSLQAAAAEGHEDLVVNLLDREVDINAQGGHFGSALQAAAAGGYESLVQILLDRGSEINQIGGEYGTALQAACHGGFQTLVHLLLEKGADVDIFGGRYGTALQAAVIGGHEAIVQMLVDKKVNVHAEGGWYHTALHAAVANGLESIVKLLLENGADVNAAGGWHGSVLVVAVEAQNQSLVQLLLDKKADVHATRGDLGTALHVATTVGNEDIIRSLLTAGADINAVTGDMETALHLAVGAGFINIVQLLVDHNANVNIVEEYWGAPLQKAAMFGRADVARILLDAGANIDAQAGEYGTALQAASALGHVRVVLLLLDRKADVNAEGGMYGNAFNAATLRGHEVVKEVLLQRRPKDT